MKQSEYDLHRSVATQCVHSKLKKIEIVLPNRLLQARYVVDVHNVDFNEQSQSKQKLVSGHLRYHINIVGRVKPVSSRHIPQKNSR